MPCRKKSCLFLIGVLLVILNDTWIIVKKSPHIKDTDNLLCIPSGETMNVEFFLTDYDQLPVGKYRIVFGIAHSNDFFTFLFDIVDP